ncbi:MAG: transcription termination/antitermination protein NusG [Clostridia bacterium]|nr:transcription termination/antitermination protein NusG [Clostridia bacterium]
MPEDNQARWYVVHTLASYENRVARNMRRMVKKSHYEDLIQDVMIPTRTVKDLRKDGQVRVKEKRLFPGYVFVKMIKTTETWYMVRNVDGVTGFVGPGGMPTPLTKAEVDRVFRVQLPIKIDIQVGDHVFFKCESEYEMLGFPKGIEMVVEMVNDNERILQISFLMEDKKNIIDCDYDFVQVVKKEDMEK